VSLGEELMADLFCGEEDEDDGDHKEK